MNWFYRHVIRPVLFTQNPEEIHRFTIGLLAWAGHHALVTDAMASFLGSPELPTTVFGLSFPNPVGLAAGMDKEGEAAPIWAAMGFGHCELGAVTSLAQPGNPSPRIFRAIPDEAIINRMGFNNEGAEAMAQRLANWHHSGLWPKHPVGINLGKTKITPLEKAPEDYAQSLRLLWAHADFFVVNVSSPNTPDLRKLQDKAALDEILAALQEVQDSMTRMTTPKADASYASVRQSLEVKGIVATNEVSDHGGKTKDQRPKTKPILVKVAPDLSFDAMDEILGLVGPRQIAGIAATNTTLARPETKDEDLSRIYAEPGGLSGRPLRDRSTEVIRHFYRQTRGSVPIVGMGGIFNADDAWEKVTAGASLLQIYTSLIYEGPRIVNQIVTGLQERLSQAGLKEISQAVGCEN